MADGRVIDLLQDDQVDPMTQAGINPTNAATA